MNSSRDEVMDLKCSLTRQSHTANYPHIFTFRKKKGRYLISQEGKNARPSDDRNKLCMLGQAHSLSLTNGKNILDRCNDKYFLDWRLKAIKVEKSVVNLNEIWITRECLRVTFQTAWWIKASSIVTNASNQTLIPTFLWTALTAGWIRSGILFIIPNLLNPTIPPRAANNAIVKEATPNRPCKLVKCCLLALTWVNTHL